MKNGLLIIISLFSFQTIFGQIAFQEITEQAGIANSDNKNHGIAFADFDNDGDQDIYAFTRLNQNKLYENLGNGTFNDVALPTGVNHNGSTRAAVWGDINNDGWLDLFIGSYQAPDRLYLNNGAVNNGNVTFTDITFDAGIFNSEETVSVHMADVDADGLLDIYVANNLAENHLYKNNGNLTFTDITNSSGTNDASHSMACAFFDYDNDGDQDLYLVHDFEVANILYQNDGQGNFTNVAQAAGVDYAGHGMGVDVADINHDGWLDFYLTDLDENVLFLNDGQGGFTDISESAGTGDTGMGWGTMFLDVDNDGWQDIYVVNDSKYSPESNVLYRNNGDLTFQKVMQNTPLASEEGGIGGACGDIDNDGFIDIVLANTFGNSGNQLFKNLPNQNNWISFKLKGTQSNRAAIGSRILIEYGNGNTQSDLIMAGTGFAGANSLNIHFGLAQYQQVAKATIYWASGQVEEFFDLATNQIYDIQEVNEPVINAVVLKDSIVEKYGKFEAALDLEATYDNAYDFDQIKVSAVFTSPSGTQKTVDGFFMQDYNLNTTSGGLTSVGDGGFRVRFSPDETGEWSFQVSVTDNEGTSNFGIQTFECTQTTNPENNGFVRTGNTNYLEFDNGEQLILIGENMAWQNSNAYTNYRNWINKLDENGGNFIRVWHAHWGLGIEWKDGSQGFEGLRRYKETNLFYQDWLYDFCAEKGVYIMPTLQHHGQVSSNVNPNWNDSPYNIANGGTCQNTWDFFTDSTARAHTRNRLRYVVARYGYSRAVQSWELFNEVNWTDDFHTHIQKVRDWHAEMGAYLKEIDPYQHLVTTSYAESDQDPEVWNNPDFDFTQTHFYINSPNLERVLVGGVRQYLTDFGKPTLVGEFGLGGSASLANADPDGIHVHNALWGSLFGGGMGTGLTWWWDNYIHPRDLYYHFAPVRTVTDDIAFVEADMQPATSYVTGAPGDLLLTPALGWGIIGDSQITVNDSGGTDPENPGLSSFLYGSEWNTEYRSPPNFSVNYLAEGEFSVTTGDSKGQSPRISIYVNGSLILDEEGLKNTTYTVLVPPGQNLIKVDNLGADWMSIQSYQFDGLGSKVDSYVLTAADNKTAAGWVFNRDYNYVNVVANEIPEKVTGSQLVVEGYEDGDYYVKWYDCLTGEIIWAFPVSATDNTLYLPIPGLQWDMAFRVDSEELMVDAAEVVLLDDFKIFPNPAQAGGEIRIEKGSKLLGDSSVSLLDSAGRLIHQSTSNQGRFQLPAQLESGLYWVSVQENNVIGAKAIFVQNKP